MNTYDDWLSDVIELCDRRRENFDELAEEHSFRDDWNAGLTPEESFNKAIRDTRWA